MPQVTATRQSVNAYDLAGQWLNALGWPNTPTNRRALAAWFMSESGRTGQNVNVIGNNPLNISGKFGNYRIVRGHYIQVYATQAEAVAAFKSLITSPNHNANGYGGVVAAFNNFSTDGTKVIKAIINTGWVTGGKGPSYWHTVNGIRKNLLADVYNSLPGTGGTVDFSGAGQGSGQGTTGTGTSGSTTGGSGAYGGGSGVGGGGASGGFNAPFDPNNIAPLKSITDLANFLGKKPTDTFTQADADKINAIIDQAAPWIKNLPFWNVVVPSIANQYVGGTVANAGAGLSNTLATDTGALNKAGGITIDNATKGLGSVAAWFLGHALGVLAIGAGGVLVLFGLYLTTKEAIGGGSEGLVSPIPVFIRENS